MKNFALLILEAILTAACVIIATVGLVVVWLGERVADAADYVGTVRHSAALPQPKAINAVDRDQVPV